MAAGDLGTLTVGLGLDLSGLQRAVAGAKTMIGGLSQNVGASMTRIGKGMQSAGRKLSTFVTAPIVALGGLSVRSFAKFEQAMRNVNVIARQGEVQFQATSRAVLDMAAALGKQPTDLANALFNINSAGFKGAEAMHVLETATRAGVGGLVDTEVAAKGITSAINAFGLEASDATDIADVLFKTNELGVTTFGELAASMGKVNATAAAAGIDFPQVGAALATITRGGIETSEATTALNAALLKVIKPTTELEKVFAATSNQTGAATLANEGLIGTLRVIRSAAISAGTGIKPLEDGLGKLGFGTRDIKAVLSLLRDDMGEFEKDLLAIADPAGRAGAASAAFAENSKSLSFQMSRLKAQTTKAAIEIGQVLAPTVRTLVDLIQRGVTWFSNLDTGTKKIIIGMAALAAAIGPVVLAVGTLLVTLGGIVALIPAITAGIPVVVGALPAIASGAAAVSLALGGVVIAVGAIVAGMTLGLAVLTAWNAEALEGEGLIQKMGFVIHDVGNQFKETLGFDTSGLDAEAKANIDRLEKLRAAQLAAEGERGDKGAAGLASDLEAAAAAAAGIKDTFDIDLFGKSTAPDINASRTAIADLASERAKGFEANVEKSIGAVESGSLEAFRVAKGLDSASKELRVAQETKKIQEELLEQQGRLIQSVVAGDRTIAEAIQAISSGSI
jgi:TP901 family phage tail tape measure protein